MDNINHAQSLNDYLKRIYPENEDIDILDNTNPYNDNDFAELANNLFSSYDDIDMRDKAFDGSIEAESLCQNTHDPHTALSINCLTNCTYCIAKSTV